jgi:hypothetical protein
MERLPESVQRIPLRDRGALRDPLAALWAADKNGWCCMTDGSCDDLSDAEAQAAIRSALDYIAREHGEVESYHLS